MFAVAMNQNQRQEAQREREQLMARIAENKQYDQQQAAKLLDDNKAYRRELLGQIDYNRRQRSQHADEMKRQEETQKEAELEYKRKIEHLLEKPVIQKVHPLRRGLYQSQSATSRLNH